MAYKFQLGAMTASGSLKTEGAFECETSITVGSAALLEAELEKLEGITNGTVAANKAVVVDGNADADGFRNVTATGAFIIGSANMDETDLEKLDGITNGTAAASKAVVLDASKNIATIGTIGCGAITSTGASSFGSITPASADGGALGSASKEWSDLYLADGGEILFGNDQDVTLTHVADTGLLFEVTNAGAGAYPSLDMRMSSSTPADNDLGALLRFSGYNDAQETVNYAGIQTKFTDVSNGSEDAALLFETMVAGSPVEMLDIGATAASTITVKDGAYDFDVASHDGTNGLKLGGTLVAASAAEINAACDASVRTAAVVSVADDHFLFCDGGATGATRVESIADLVTLQAGTGIDASNGQFLVTAAQTRITSLLATDIKIGEDDQTKIDFEDANKINFYANNVKELVLEADLLSPGANDGLALGNASLGFSDLFLADGAEIKLGNDQDVSLVHSADSGLILHTVNAGGTNPSKLTLRLSSSSPADNDIIGSVTFAGYTDDQNAADFASINAKSTDVTDGSKDSGINFEILVNNSVTEMMDIGITAAGVTTMQEIVDLADHDGSSKGLKLGGTLVTSTAAELNKLDGAGGSVTAAKLTTLTALTDAEIGYLDGAAVGNSTASKVLVLDANADFEMQDKDKIFFGDGADVSIHRDGTNMNIGTDTSGAPIYIGHSTSEVTINDNLTVTGDLTINGTTTTVNSTTIAITSSFTFEGATPDAHETVLGVVDPTADATLNLPAMSAGTYYVPVMDAASTTAITATPAEINLLDATAGSSVALADGDGFLMFDATDSNTCKKVLMSDIETYIGGLNVQNVDDSGTLQIGMNYWADLGGAESATLPASPTVGNIVYVKAPSNCSSTNTITISKGSADHRIDGEHSILLESPYAAVSLCYVAADIWRIF